MEAAESEDKTRTSGDELPKRPSPQPRPDVRSLRHRRSPLQSLSTPSPPKHEKTPEEVRQDAAAVMAALEAKEREVREEQERREHLGIVILILQAINCHAHSVEAALN